MRFYAGEPPCNLGVPGSIPGVWVEGKDGQLVAEEVKPKVAKALEELFDRSHVDIIITSAGYFTTTARVLQSNGFNLHELISARGWGLSYCLDDMQHRRQGAGGFHFGMERSWK